MNQIKAMLKNWRTSVIGIIILVAIALWAKRVIETEEFIMVLSFVSGLGFFISKDNTVTGIPK
jgi:hypothetical protein